jgi:hypothetical protein
MKHERCAACMESSETASWWKFAVLEVAAGVMEKQPLDDLCEKCGLAMESFPTMNKQEVLRMLQESGVFRGEWQILISFDPKSGKSFRPSLVKIQHRVGLRVSHNVALVSLAEFSRVMGMPHEKLKLEAAMARSFPFVGADGNEITGVAMSLEDLPDAEFYEQKDNMKPMEYLRAELFSESETTMVQYVMKEESQLRPQQAGESYAKTAQMMGQERGEPLSNPRKVWSFADWSAKVEAAQVKLRNVERELLAGTGVGEAQPQAFSAASAAAGPVSFRAPSLNLGGKMASSNASTMASGPSSQMPPPASRMSRSSSRALGGQPQQGAKRVVSPLGLTAAALSARGSPSEKKSRAASSATTTTPSKSDAAAKSVSVAFDPRAALGSAGSKRSRTASSAAPPAVTPQQQQQQQALAARGGRQYRKKADCDISSMLAGKTDGRSVAPVTGKSLSFRIGGVIVY